MDRYDKFLWIAIKLILVISLRKLETKKTCILLVTSFIDVIIDNLSIHI